MDRQSRERLLDEPKCIEKDLRKEASKARFGASGEQNIEDFFRQSTENLLDRSAPMDLVAVEERRLRLRSHRYSQ